jgi:hypothetical protein
LQIFAGQILITRVTRLLLLQYLLTLLICGCSETASYYEADTAGRWRKTTVSAHLWGYRANAATYVINGIKLEYYFRAIGGSAEIRGEGETHLAPGPWKRAFYKLRGPPSLSTRRVLFGGFIRRLHDASLTTDRLASKAHRGRDTQDILGPATGHVVVEYREVNGLRWLVTTRFADSEKQVVNNRTYWTVIHGLLINFSADLSPSFALDSESTRCDLDSLDQLVSDFRCLT